MTNPFPPRGKPLPKVGETVVDRRQITFPGCGHLGIVNPGEVMADVCKTCSNLAKDADTVVNSLTRQRPNVRQGKVYVSMRISEWLHNAILDEAHANEQSVTGVVVAALVEHFRAKGITRPA